MEKYFIGVLLVTYLSFVFSSEQLNPLSKPKLYHARERWRHGRKVALAGFLCGVVFCLLHTLAELPLLTAGIYLSMVFAVLWVMITKIDKSRSRI